MRLLTASAVQSYVSKTPDRLCIIAGDAEGYWELGQRLARGESYEIYSPPRRILRMPGFPAVLGMSIALFGDSPMSARFLLAFIGTLACGAVYWLGTVTTGHESGLIAATIAALSPTFTVFSVMFLSETLFALTLLVSLVSLVRMRQISDMGRPEKQVLFYSIAAGFAAALACYVRPSWLLFPAFFGFWQLTEACVAKRTSTALSNLSLRAAAIMFFGMHLGLTLGLTPWTIRNAVVTQGHFVPTTLWMGPSLYDGLNPDANGDSHMEFMKHDALYQKLSEYEVDQHYRKEAWRWAFENPLKVLRLAWLKQVRYWNLLPNSPQFSAWPVQLGVILYTCPVILAVAAATFYWYRSSTANMMQHPPFWILVLLLGPMLYFAALHTLFVSSLRYRLPTEYSLLVFASWGIWNLIKNGLPPSRQMKTEIQNQASITVRS